ncbi:unnamed protein product, partial [Ectocarpus fasciculatus]
MPAQPGVTCCNPTFFSRRKLIAADTAKSAAQIEPPPQDTLSQTLKTVVASMLTLMRGQPRLAFCPSTGISSRRCGSLSEPCYAFAARRMSAFECRLMQRPHTCPDSDCCPISLGAGSGRGDGMNGVTRWPGGGMLFPSI